MHCVQDEWTALKGRKLMLFYNYVGSMTMLKGQD